MGRWLVLGALWGVEGVAWMYAACAATLWPVGYLWLRKSTAPLGRLFRNGLRIIAVYGLAAGASFASTLWLPADDAVLRLVVGFAAFVAVLALIALVFAPLRRDLREIAAARRFLRRTHDAHRDPADETARETS